MATSQPNDTNESSENAIPSTTNQSASKDSKEIQISAPKRWAMELFPAELLFEIAGRLNKLDLCDLSLVSRRWAAIAQAELHRFPMIGANPWSQRLLGRSVIALLARTLKDRPDLAGKVRRLYIRPSTDLVDVEMAKYPSWSFTYDPYAQCVPETKIVGDILTLVSLKFFNIHITRDDDWWAKHGHRSPLDCFPAHLFGENACYGPDGQPNFSLVSGLANVEHVVLSGSNVHWAWSCLPKLRVLHIGVKCKILEPMEPSQACRLTSLSIDREVNLLCFGTAPDIGFERFLAGLESLVILETGLCNMSMEESEAEDPTFWGHLTSGDMGRFDQLINILAPVARKLQKLRISECYHTDGYEHSSSLDFVEPFTSLAQFEQLDVLELPCEALVGPGQRALADVIPESIRCLTVLAPSWAIIPLLEEFPVDYPGALQVIEFRTSDSRGASSEEWLYRLRPFWSHLSDAWVVLDVFCECGDCHEWLDMDYDPFVCEVIEYLDGL